MVQGCIVIRTNIHITNSRNAGLHGGALKSTAIPNRRAFCLRSGAYLYGTRLKPVTFWHNAIVVKMKVLWR
jgi:hypothetical protein